MSSTDDYFMQQAIELAEKGRWAVEPNPIVGCVIVNKDNLVVSQGYHKLFGSAHAEVNAINDLPNHISPKECTLYVTLEPCSHFGKTPPCADLIIKKGFKRVVICNLDPNPLVAGSGIKKLKEANIEVLQGVMEENGKILNRRFFSFFEKKRPYFILKWAQTADGYISRPIPFNKEENKITGIEVQKFVHEMRANEMGIMIGKNTVLYDNPYLTNRFGGKNPIRIILDRKLEIPNHYNVFNTDAQTIIFNQIKDEKQSHINYIKLNFHENSLFQVSQKLYELNIQSVLVEGGARLLNDFIAQNLFDEILIFENPNLKFGSGLKAPSYNLNANFEFVGDDKLYHFINN